MKQVLFLFIMFPMIMVGQNLVPFEKGDKMGYKDQNSKIVLKPIYEYAMEFSDKGIAAVVINSEWWYINSKGEKLIKPMVVDNGPDYFNEGFSRYKENEKIGFIDETGKIVIKAQFEYVGSFYNGLAVVNIGGYFEQVDEYKLRKGGKWGYINTSGELVIKAEYDFANDFERGYASITKEGKSFYIDSLGNTVSNKIAEDILYGEELNNQQNIENIQESNQNYFSDAENIYKECMIKLIQEINQLILKEGQLTDSYLNMAEKCRQEYFQSMKGAINMTKELQEDIIKAEFLTRTKLFQHTKQTANIFETHGYKSTIDLSVENKNPLINWETEPTVFAIIKFQKSNALFFLPSNLIKTNQLTGLGSNDNFPLLIGSIDSLLIFAQYNNFEDKEFNNVIEKIYGSAQSIKSPNSGIDKLKVFSNYLYIQANENFLPQHAFQMLEKYGEKDLYLIFPQQNSARYIPFTQKDFNFSWE